MRKKMAEKEFCRDLRRPVLENTVPCYILDSYFQIVDWNPALHEILAKTYNLEIGMSATRLIDFLENEEECRQRSVKVFGLQKIPLVDHEPIVFNHPKYGIINCHKFAAQILGPEGQGNAWSVQINICQCDEFEQLAQDLMGRVERELLWSKYGSALNRLLPELDWNYFDYGKGVATKLLVLGTGPGIGLNQVMADFPQAKFTGLEFNETMRELTKIQLGDRLENIDYIKEEPDRMGQFKDKSFDLCLSGEGLHRGTNVEGALEEVSRCLEAKGRFCFSLYSQDFSAQTMGALITKQTSKSNEAAKDVLLECLVDLEKLIVGYSPDQTKTMLEKTGFTLEGHKQALGGLLNQYQAVKN